jgi:hypothetical protein
MEINMEVQGFSNKLGLFQAPPTETGIENNYWVQIRPTSQITSGGVIDFTVPGNTLQYLNLFETTLRIVCKVVNKDGSDTAITDFATPSNLLLHSLWSQMDVSIGQKAVSPGISTRYPYKAMLDVVMGMNKNEWGSKGVCMMYYRDNYLNMDANIPASSPVNTALFNRHERSKLSKTIDMEGPLYNDIFQQKRLLLNGVAMSIKLYPSSDAFRLLSNKTDYKIEITDAILKVCYVKVSPGILLGHSEALKIGPARYFFDESVIKTFAIASGQYSLTADDIFQGNVPKSLTVALVSSEALNGSFNKNPYNFKNYDVNFCGFYVDGQSCPFEALQPNFDSGAYIAAYITAIKESSLNGITFDEFKSGYTIYKFDLRQSKNGVLSEKKEVIHA